MIIVGKAYNSVNGERFLILAKKNRASTNGCSFIGENVKTGLVTFFNYQGKHSMNADWNLNTDFYKWIGIHNGMLASSKFMPKEKLDKTIKYSGYLRIENDEEHTITYQSPSNFQGTYA